VDQINLIPAVVQLRAAIGASVSIRLDVKRKDGTPFDLSAYDITAPFVTDDSSVPPVAEWTHTVQGSSVFLTVAEADTVALAPTGKSITWHWVVWFAHSTAPERLLAAHGNLGLLPP